MFTHYEHQLCQSWKINFKNLDFPARFIKSRTTPKIPTYQKHPRNMPVSLTNSRVVKVSHGLRSGVPTNSLLQSQSPKGLNWIVSVLEAGNMLLIPLVWKKSVVHWLHSCPVHPVGHKKIPDRRWKTNPNGRMFGWFLLQIEGPTQANIYGFKTSPIENTNAVRESANLSVLSLEVLGKYLSLSSSWDVSYYSLYQQRLMETRFLIPILMK